MGRSDYLAVLITLFIKCNEIMYLVVFPGYFVINKDRDTFSIAISTTLNQGFSIKQWNDLSSLQTFYSQQKVVGLGMDITISRTG